MSGVGVGVSWVAVVVNVTVTVAVITPEIAVEVMAAVSTGIAVASIWAGEGDTSGSGSALLLRITRAQPELAASAIISSKNKRSCLMNQFDIMSVLPVILAAKFSARINLFETILAAMATAPHWFGWPAWLRVDSPV